MVVDQLPLVMKYHNEYSTYNNYDSLYRFSSLSLGNSDNNISREYSYCTSGNLTSNYIYEMLHKKII